MAQSSPIVEWHKSLNSSSYTVESKYIDELFKSEDFDKLVEYVKNSASTLVPVVLRMACTKGHEPLVQLTIQSSKYCTPQYALIYACQSSQLKLVKSLLTTYKDELMQATVLDSTLIAACSGGNHAIVKLLIDHGATPYEHENQWFNCKCMVIAGK